MSHADAVETVAARPARNSFARVWREHPAVLVVTALAAAALAAAILSLRADTGDEPPIRVKNGSFDVDLLSSYEEFQPVAGSNHWKITGGDRKKDALQVDVLTSGTGCSSGTATASDRLLITYSDGVFIEFKSTGRHTTVKPKPGTSLTLVTNQLLRYQTTGFITTIVIDNQTTPMCTFTSAGQLNHLVILDF